MKLFFLFLMGIAFLPCVFAQSIGIAPAILEFDEGHLERTIVVYNPNEYSIETKVRMTKFENQFENIPMVLIAPKSSQQIKIKLKEFNKPFETMITASYQNQNKGLGLQPKASAKIKVNPPELWMHEFSEETSQVNPLVGLALLAMMVLMGCLAYFLINEFV